MSEQNVVVLVWNNYTSGSSSPVNCFVSELGIVLKISFSNNPYPDII
jgi:hypothetical protein